jgi:hypothetical protein
VRRLQYKKAILTSVADMYSTRYEVSSLVGLTYVYSTVITYTIIGWVL